MITPSSLALIRDALVEHDNGESATWLEQVDEQDYETAQTSR
jgi:hypothetical protein